MPRIRTALGHARSRGFRLGRTTTHAIAATIVAIGLQSTAALAATAPAAPTPAAPASGALEHLAAVKCADFARLQARYSKQFATKLSSWSTAQLPDLQNRPALYLFSGPDIVTAMALFPTASHLTLIADQKPEYELLTQADADSAAQTARECKMLGFFSRLGYYRTDDLNGKNGARPRFIKLLVYSIAFGGASVTDTQLLSVGAKGELVASRTGAVKGTQGVRFDARRADGRMLQIDYLEIDLSNHGLKPDSGAVAFIQQNARDVLFLKSASHLLQSPHFSRLADLLVNPPAPFVVQDETGLGIDRLRKAYRLSLYGKFTGPQALWAKSPSAHALADDYATHEVAGPLPFTIGYEKKAGSALLVGRRAGH